MYVPPEKVVLKSPKEIADAGVPASTAVYVKSVISGVVGVAQAIAAGEVPLPPPAPPAVVPPRPVAAYPAVPPELVMAPPVVARLPPVPLLLLFELTHPQA